MGSAAESFSSYSCECHLKTGIVAFVTAETAYVKGMAAAEIQTYLRTAPAEKLREALSYGSELLGMLLDAGGTRIRRARIASPLGLAPLGAVGRSSGRGRASSPTAERDRSRSRSNQGVLQAQA